MVDLDLNQIPKNSLIDEAEKSYHDPCIMKMNYDIQNNWFVDDNGFIIYQPYRYITPGELLLFKRDLQTRIFERPMGEYVVVLAPE